MQGLIETYVLLRVVLDGKVNYHIRPADEDHEAPEGAKVTVIDELDQDQVRFLKEDIDSLENI